MKRLLSLILAIAMCISLFPVFAAAADNSVLYNFGSPTKRVASAFNASAVQGHRVLGYELPNSTSRPSFNPDSKTITMAATYQLDVSADGTYTPSITFVPSRYSPVVEVFLTKKSTEISSATSDSDYKNFVFSLDSASRLGSFDAYSTADVQPNLVNLEDSADEQTDPVEEKTTRLINTTLEAGTYYLTLVMNGANTDMVALEDYWHTTEANVKNPLTMLYPQTFTLTPASAPARDHKYDLSLTATTSEKSIDNNNLATVSWLKKGDANAPILDTTTGTDEYQLSCRLGGGIDNSPSLVNGTFVSQFLYKRWYKEEGNIDSSVTSETPAKENYEAGKIQYGIRIKIKQPGIYNLSLENEISAADLRTSYTASKSFLNSDDELMSGAVTKVYFAKATDTASEILEDTAASRNNENAAYKNNEYPVVYLGLYDSRKMESVTEYGTITVPEAGQYYIIFKADAESLDKTKGGNPEICEVISSNKEYLYHYQLFLLSGIELSKVTTAEDEALAAEQAKYDTVKTAKEGAIASATAVGLNDFAYINIIGADVAYNSSVEGATDRVETTRGAEKEITAKEVDGYEFLYWAKGLGTDRRVVSTDPTYTVKATSGGTWLYAYYKKAESSDVSVMFYNADGSVISQALVGEGEDITFPADDPTFNSYSFKGWALGSADNIVASAKASGDKMLFVAQYEEPNESAKTYKVTVNGDVGYHAYGEAVTAIAAERDGTDLFVYWKKGDEIVSFDKEYTFNVFENCELTAEYAAYKPVTDALRKIIIKGEGENIIAEFIGLDSAVETGILFHETATDISLGNASHKIAMTTDGNHLAALNDVGNCIGYAILSNGSVIYDK